MSKEKQLTSFLPLIQEQSNPFITDTDLKPLIANMESVIKLEYEEMEDVLMPSQHKIDNSLRFIKLPSMRDVYNIAVSISPEDEAMRPVMGCAHLFLMM